MNKPLEGLNKEQKEAVLFDKKPLLIIAGAGTGKTSVITRKIAYLISTKKAKPSEILALTFTDKAAAEMEQRVDLLIPYGYADVLISTFHSFGDELLRDNALRLGLTADFRVLTKAEQIIFFKEHLFEFSLSSYRPLGNPTRYIEAIVGLFSRAKDEDVGVQEYFKYAEQLEKEAKSAEEKELAQRQKELALCYQKYEQLLLENNCVDFGNQVYLTLKLFREHPSILKEYQQKFRYILVDEFQDTNYSQFQLVKLLSGKQNNVTAVADDDQCLPEDALIDTPKGRKKIRDIKKGDAVITAVGKGHIGVSRVNRVWQRRKKARFLTFITEGRYKTTVTSNHKMFCFVPRRWMHDKKTFYVYLMWRKGLGWRLGITDNLAVRLKIERSADKIIGLRAFSTEQEAQYFESLLAFKYGIPTACFMKREGLYMVDNWLKKLYAELNTEKRVKKLAQDLDIDLNFHHYCLDGVTRGNKVRLKINLDFCYRRYVSKVGKNRILINPSILHKVVLETSDSKTIAKLKKAGVSLKKAKKGLRVLFHTSDIKKAENFAEHLRQITDGIVEYRFSLGKLKTQHKPAMVMPASNVLIGHFLPIRKGNRIVYDKIKEIKEEIRTKDVYDLEIDRTHNFIADGVAVHNCIFRFRGAAIGNILNFKKAYPGLKEIVLTQNYRSTQRILDTAYRLIQYNNPQRLEAQEGIDKKLISQSAKHKAQSAKAKKQKELFEKEEKSILFSNEVDPVRSPPMFIGDSPDKSGLTSNGVEHLHFETLSDEADKVAEIIKKGVYSHKYSYQDFAILVRSNNDAAPFIQALNIKGIPWSFSGNQKLYAREEIRNIIAFLKVITNLSDSINLYYLASSEIYQLDTTDLTRAMNYASRRRRGLYEVFSSIYKIPELQSISTESRATIEKIVKDIQNYIKLSRQQTTGRLIYLFLTESGYINRLSKSSNPADEQKIENIAKFFDIVKNSEILLQEDRVINFVGHLDALTEVGDDPATAEIDPDIPVVNILTIHKAKGLEFRVVFLVSLVMHKFPLPDRRQEFDLPEELIKDILPEHDFHLQEERRLFYVGMTRTKENLFLTSARDYGGKRPRKVSQFVLEALDIPVIKEVSKTSALEKIRRNLPSPPAAILKRRFSADNILNLSYFQIDDYLTCPLKYKYVHILRVPILPHHAVVYGRAMHIAVGYYYQKKMQKKGISKIELLAHFNSAFINEGFLTREHEELAREQGKKALSLFFDNEEQSKKLPAYIEKRFSFLLNRDKISGRWDRIDVDEEETAIIDFKSSKVLSQEQADKRAKESLQLSIYALAYKNIFGKIPDRVGLYFLEAGLLGTYSPSESDLEKTIEKISQASQGIRDGNFSAKPSYFACQFCAYRGICPQGNK